MMHDPQPPWWEAVTAEFVYEQGQVHNNLNSVACQPHHQFAPYDQQQHQLLTPSQNLYPNAYHLSQHQSVASTASNSPLGYSSQSSRYSPSCLPSDQFSVPSTPTELYSASPIGAEYLTDYHPTSYAPCDGPRPWNYAYCYGYYGEPACPLINMVDMEDFM